MPLPSPDESAKPPIRYRPATLADVTVAAALRTQSGWDGGAGAGVMERYLRGEHHPQHARSSRIMLLAARGDELVGYIAGHHSTRFDCDGELQWLLVSPHARGSGIAATLVIGLLRWFAETGARRICVNVAPENDVARRLCQRLGATPLSEFWMVWEDGLLHGGSFRG